MIKASVAPNELRPKLFQILGNDVSKLDAPVIDYVCSVIATGSTLEEVSETVAPFLMETGNYIALMSTNFFRAHECS